MREAYFGHTVEEAGFKTSALVTLKLYLLVSQTLALKAYNFVCILFFPPLLRELLAHWSNSLKQNT